MPDSFSVLKYESREEWLELRGRGIGGSDVSAIMGLNEYKSPLQLWLEKTGRVEPRDLSDNEAVQWGVTLEPVIRDRFAARHPEYTVQLPSGIYCSNECPWERASLDGEICDKESGTFGVLEIKTVGERRAEDWRDGPPVYYQTQVTHYLNVTGYSFAWFAVLIGGQKYREYRFWPDDEDRRAVRDAVRAFWGYVQRDEAPRLVGHRDEGQALTDYNGTPGEGMAHDATGAVDTLLERYQALGVTIGELEQERRNVSNMVKERIGADKGVTTDIFKATWTRPERTQTDLKRLAADHPGLLEQYQTKRRIDGGLRVSEIKR